MASAPTDFGRVYDEQVAAIYGFLAYRVRDRNLAEDLTQTTFEQALRAWGRYDARKASVRTWLLVIARNTLIDHHRKHRRERLVGEVDDASLPPVAGPETRLGASPELTAALAQLSDRDREVIALRYGGDLPGPEIATMLDLSLANVQQILSRSLRRLRVSLDSADGEVGAGLAGPAPE